MGKTSIGPKWAGPSLLQIWHINNGFTSVKEIPDVKRNMNYVLLLVSILLEIKNL
jgi:hypothetical protein